MKNLQYYFPRPKQNKKNALPWYKPPPKPTPLKKLYPPCLVKPTQPHFYKCDMHTWICVIFQNVYCLKLLSHEFLLEFADIFREIALLWNNFGILEIAQSAYTYKKKLHKIWSRCFDRMHE